jgi:hypothetical protein
LPQLVGVGVEELGVGNSVIAIAIKESAPVVDDNGWRRVVWLEWVLASVEAAALVVSNDCGTNDHSRGWNGGRLVKTALPMSVEVVEQLANSVKDELDIESHGAGKFEVEDRMNLIPLVNSTNLTNSTQ